MILQEHQATSLTRLKIVHKSPVERRVLNTAQMRDARFVQPFRYTTPHLDTQSKVQQNAKAIYTAQRKKVQATTSSSTPARAPPPQPASSAP
jgi:hypothetical protein